MPSKVDPVRQDTQIDSLNPSPIPNHEISQTDSAPCKLRGQVLDNKNSDITPRDGQFHESQLTQPNGDCTSEKEVEALSPFNLSSLPAEAPISSSDFPSPSSSFIPPPTLDEREFAIRDVPQKQPESPSVSTPTAIVLPPPETVNESSMFEEDEPKPSLFSNTSDPSSSKSEPTTPRRAVASHSSTSNLQLSPVFSLPTSTRPAPQSPVASRRTSRVISNPTSSPRLRPQNSGRDSFQARPARMSSLSVSSFPPGTKLFIKIIDFAFDAGDIRRCGFGEHVPKVNRPTRMNRRLTLSDQSSGAETETEEEEGDEEFEGAGDGWGGIGWGRMPYSFPSFAAVEGSSHDSAPTQGQLDANFGQDSDDEYHSAEDDEQDLYEGGEHAPLYPGLYRALYAFEPEATSEMKLEPGQMVTVRGRGGGDGWAIALREDGQHALVPEDYLELVRLDGEDED